MRRYYELGDRLICVDIPSTLKSSLYQEVLQREGAAEAKLITKDEWHARRTENKNRTHVEWYDHQGSF